MPTLNLTKKPVADQCHANRCKAEPEFIADASWLDGDDGSFVELCESHTEKAIKVYSLQEDWMDIFLPLGDDEDEEEPEDTERDHAEPSTERAQEEAEYDKAAAMDEASDYDPEGAFMSAYPYSPVKKGKAMLTDEDKAMIIHLRLNHKMQDASIATKMGVGVKVIRWYIEHYGADQTQSDLILSDEVKQIAKEATSEGKENLTELKAFEIAGQDDLDFAAEVLAEVKGKWKRLDAEEKKITRPMNEALKAARDLFRQPKKILLQAEGLLKGKIGAWSMDQERRNSEAMQEAAEAHKKNSPAARKAAIKKMGSTDQVKGISVSMSWDFMIEDEEAVPREFLLIDERKIKAHAKESTGKEPAPISGIRFFQKANVSSGSK